MNDIATIIRFSLENDHVIDDLERGPIPSQAAEDALHIAIAVANGVDYLLTWNYKHIANASMRSAIEDECRSQGYAPARLC